MYERSESRRKEAIGDYYRLYEAINADDCSKAVDIFNDIYNKSTPELVKILRLNIDHK